MKEPKVIEIFADNGEHSHWQLIDDNGEILWTEEPAEVKNNAVLPHVSNCYDRADMEYAYNADKDWQPFDKFIEEYNAPI